MKILWLDTETTGVTANSYPYQFAGIIEIDGEVKEKFDIKCKPFSDAEISQEALTVTGKTEEEIKSYQDPKEAYNQIITIFSKYIDKFDKTDKFVIAGHNVSFDFDMTLKWFKKCGDNYFGSWVEYKRNFDTLAVIRSFQVVGIFPITENNKLTTIAEKLGIKLEFAHDAMYDIEATRLVGLRLMKALEKIKNKE